MKKMLWSIAIVIFLGLGLSIFQFYWSDLRGIGPAVKPPPADIVELMEEHETGSFASSAVNNTDFPLSLPDGFTISIFARDLGNPRVMMRGPEGSILVSIPDQGKVVALRDTDYDGTADEAVTIVEGLNRPHGLAERVRIADVAYPLYNNTIYIAEEDQVAEYDFDLSSFKILNKRKILDLPTGGRHWTRTIMFYNDKLLVSIGSSCDTCYEDDPWRGSIIMADSDGSNPEFFAQGLRNAVFLNLHPVTGDVWVTEMGRDHLGDDLPPDEINIVQEGNNYGWPICYGTNIHDTDFDNKSIYKKPPCQEPDRIPSHIDLQAHSAPLGLAFISEEGWPEEYWFNLLVAFHGSWNRSEPTGYKIVRFMLDELGTVLDTEDFIDGWLTDAGALGRPVDILAEPGGIIYISDDKAGVIYRVAYTGSSKDVSDLIIVTIPKLTSSVESPLTVQGRARGFWFFEGSFPVRLEDANGKIIATGIATAQREWMTEDFIPFEAILKFAKPSTSDGTLILEKDNPSGLPEHDASIKIPVQFN
jgi:glucose/arabinose dehydrogenase